MKETKENFIDNWDRSVIIKLLFFYRYISESLYRLLGTLINVCLLWTKEEFISFPFKNHTKGM